MKHFRTTSKLSIEDVSEKTGLSKGIIEKSEQGNFWVGILPILAEVYNVNSDMITQNGWAMPFNQK